MLVHKACIIGHRMLAERELWNKFVFLSVLFFFLSPRLSRCFLRIGNLVFINFGMVLENHMKLCVTELEVLKIIFFATKLRKASHIFLHLGRKKKYSCFRKCGWREKSSSGRLQIYFFKSFSGDIIFSSLVCFTFLYFWGFFCLLVCFFKLKVYILIHIWLWGWVRDKKSFTRPIYRNKTACFYLIEKFVHCFFWICSLTKVDVIFNVLSQITYLRNM